MSLLRIKRILKALNAAPRMWPKVNVVLLIVGFGGTGGNGNLRRMSNIAMQCKAFET
jgi:hypothetical protein